MSHLLDVYYQNRKKIPPNITNVSKDMERLEDFCTTGGNVKEYSHMKIVYSICSKNKNIKLTYELVMLLDRLYIYIVSKRITVCVYIPMFTAALFT